MTHAHLSSKFLITVHGQKDLMTVKTVISQLYSQKLKQKFYATTCCLMITYLNYQNRLEKWYMIIVLNHLQSLKNYG